MDIFIAVIRHKHGVNVIVAGSEEGREKELDKYVCLYWDEEVGEEDAAVYSAWDRINYYFEHAENESLGLYTEELLM